ncbi:hypothetical protein CWS02_04365 [Enterobacter sp. EA-1]|nr:hypothetical protein CWS02_04365 [Enterobacter sp. EA-1]
MPGAGASAFSFLDLAELFPVSSPVYVLQARGLTDVARMPHLTVEETARDYICAMQQIQPHGPYFVIGHSFGGWIATGNCTAITGTGRAGCRSDCD